MKNKDIDNMLNTLRKHSPDWIDRIRNHINRLENDLLAYRRPIGHSVVDVKLKAKKEVFDDDKLKELMIRLNSIREPRDKVVGDVIKVIEELEEHHLSTFPKEKQHNSGLKKDLHQ